jgi:hypothetical protein
MADDHDDGAWEAATRVMPTPSSPAGWQPVLEQETARMAEELTAAAPPPSTCPHQRCSWPWRAISRTVFGTDDVAAVTALHDGIGCARTRGRLCLLPDAELPRARQVAPHQAISIRSPVTLSPWWDSTSQRSQGARCDRQPLSGRQLHHRHDDPTGHPGVGTSHRSKLGRHDSKSDKVKGL